MERAKWKTILGLSYEGKDHLHADSWLAASRHARGSAHVGAHLLYSHLRGSASTRITCRWLWKHERGAQWGP